MIDERVIRCPYCGYVLGTQEGFMFLYMPNDLLCPQCGKVAIRTSNPKF